MAQKPEFDPNHPLKSFLGASTEESRGAAVRVLLPHNIPDAHGKVHPHALEGIVAEHRYVADHLSQLQFGDADFKEFKYRCNKLRNFATLAYMIDEAQLESRYAIVVRGLWRQQELMEIADTYQIPAIFFRLYKNDDRLVAHTVFDLSGKDFDDPKLLEFYGKILEITEAHHYDMPRGYIANIAYAGLYFP